MKVPGKTALLLLAAGLLLGACRLSLRPLGDIDAVIKKAAGGDDQALALLTDYFTSPVEGEPFKAFGALIAAKERAVPPLLKALESADPAVAEAAAGALGNIRDPRAVGPLIKALDRPSFPRYVAVWALGEIGRDEAIEPLARVLGNPDREVRKSAARALIKFGEKAVPAMIEMLQSPDPEARHYAARVLGQSGDKRAMAPLMSHWASLDPAVALWALGRLGAKDALSLVVKELANVDWRIRLAAVQALGALGDRRAVPHLERMLDDPEWVVREWSARGLEDITPERRFYRDQYGKLVAPYNLYR